MSARSGRRRSSTRLTPRGRIVVVALLVLPALVILRRPWRDPGAPALSAPAVSSSPAASVPAGGRSPQPGPSATGTSGLPACVDADVAAEDADYDDWASTVRDTEHLLAAGYRPPDLEPVEEAGFEEDLKVRALVIGDLTALREAAEEAGYPIDVVAAYRSFTLQEDLFRRRSQELGYAIALTKTAKAGHSEHQLATTLDFKTLGEPDVSSTWGATPTGAWMVANAYRFGFVMSYPDGMTDRTCFAYEPWHFRYFGRALAVRIHDSGLVTREFLWRQAHPDESA